MNTILRQDALVVLSAMSDNSVDFTLTDPPWDEYDGLHEYIEQIKRVSKRWAILGREYSTTELSLDDSFVIMTHSDCFSVACNFTTGQMYTIGDDVNEHRTLCSRVFPLSIAEQIILDHTDAGDLVCDPFCGSGTIPLAAKRQGRRFIGCDIRRECYEISARRVG